MIGWYPPEPIQWVRIVTMSTTGTVTIGSSEVFSTPDPAWFTFAAAVPDQTELERKLEAFRKFAALRRLWSRLAFAERTRVARRLRPRAPVNQPSLSTFARRTCSVASRWMVMQ